MNRAELRKLIQEMSLELKERLENGKDIDTILDEENPFSIFEPFLKRSPLKSSKKPHFLAAEQRWDLVI